MRCGQEGFQQEGTSDLGSGMQMGSGSGEGRGRTENIPGKHGEAAVRAGRADGGEAAFGARMARKQYAQAGVMTTQHYSCVAGTTTWERAKSGRPFKRLWPWCRREMMRG